MSGSNAKLAFDRLYSERQAIEKDFGGILDWQRLDDKTACRVAVARTDLDPTNEKQWSAQHAWFFGSIDALPSRISGPHKSTRSRL